MSMRARAAAAAMLLSGIASAAPLQCLGRGSSQWQVDETLLLVANPEGFENQLRANLCVPLFARPGVLFDYTQWDVGVFNYVSPVYVEQGVYVDVAPLSFLQLRADFAGLVEWPLPLDGAGYFSLPGYTNDYRDTQLPAADAKSALGLNATFSAVLQGAVPLGARLELLASDTALVDWWLVGTGAYYVNLRRDVVLARSDLLIKNIAFLMLSFTLLDGVWLRAGAVDDLSVVPASHAVINILSGYFSVPLRRDGALRELEPYVRLGAYTNHPWRRGFTLMAGISLGWALPRSDGPHGVN
jgi:hypothetical protein